MKPTYIAIVLTGIGLALGIVYLVRRDHIYIRQALFWLAVATASFLLAVFAFPFETAVLWSANRAVRRGEFRW